MQRRYEKLGVDYETLKSENNALQNELKICKAKLECVESAEAEFAQEIQQVKQIKAQYEKAYRDLMAAKRRYSDEVSKLIHQMKH